MINGFQHDNSFLAIEIHTSISNNIYILFYSLSIKNIIGKIYVVKTRNVVGTKHQI